MSDTFRNALGETEVVSGGPVMAPDVKFYLSATPTVPRSVTDRMRADAAPKGVADGAGGGVKADTGKPVFDLLPVESLAEIARVLEFGAKKYDAWNWAKGMKWLRLGNACLRHIFAWLAGEDKDQETGLSHLAHAGCCILFLLSYEQTGRGEDDRRKRA